MTIQDIPNGTTVCFAHPVFVHGEAECTIQHHTKAAKPGSPQLYTHSTLVLGGARLRLSPRYKVTCPAPGHYHITAN